VAGREEPNRHYEAAKAERTCPEFSSAIGTAAIGLLVTVLVTAAVPARRAARIEPMTALKAD
jgi:hypothetical protein